MEDIKRNITSWTGTELVISKEKGDISDLARDAASVNDVVVACGGDGTLREVATGLLASDTPMGILPLGSGNDFAKTAGIPKNMKEALELLANGEPKPVDLGTCNGDCFLNTLGFGFDGLTNYHAEQIINLPGSWRYTLAALKANCEQDPFSAVIESDAGNLQERLLMVTFANGRIEGGRFRVAPSASISDGLLEMVVIDPVSAWVLPFLLPHFFFGTQHYLDVVETYSIQHATISLENKVYLHADGEVLGKQSGTFNIGIIPNAITVIR